MDTLREIVEIKNRIFQIETQLTNLSHLMEQYGMNNGKISSNEETKKRDKTRYLFNGKIYLKGKLVLAVIQQFMKINSNCSFEELSMIFHGSLQGSYGVVQPVDLVRMKYTDYERFYPDIIKTSTVDCYVCKEWTCNNIGAFVLRAMELGFQIKKIVPENN